MMKDKEKILLYACWAVLIAYFLIKMLGGNYFEIACENERFIAFCNWLDNNLVAKLVISTITTTTSNYLIYLSITKQKIGKDWWIILLCLPISIIKHYISVLGLIMDLSIMILIPLLKYRFKNILRVIIGNVLVLLFQVISLITKNIGLSLPTEYSLIALIYMIDYYLMIILYYLYTHKKKET